MKLARILSLIAILGYGWQSAAAVNEPLREIQIAEAKRALTPALLLALDDASPIAVRAALAIGRTKRFAGRTALRAHLATSDVALRAMCAYALGLLADAGAMPALYALARTDRNSAVRYAAVDALGRIALAAPTPPSRKAALEILAVARGDADSTVRAHAAVQLDAFRRQRETAAEIARGLAAIVDGDRDEDVRWHAAWTIYRAYATLVRADFLTRALHDRSELVRVEAARAWGRPGARTATALLETALNDPSWRVQYEVREALKRIAHAPPTEHLTAVPPGVHLPLIAPQAAPSPQLPAASAPATAPASAPPLGPPDAATIDLAPSVTPATAQEMNAPAAGPHARVRIATTKGAIVVRLYREWAPSTVANFLSLAQRGYFDGNRWFRIVPDFVVQTGDPNDNGEGDAGYMIPAEENPLEQRSGIIAMGLNYDAHGAIRDSAGTQFYFTLSPQLHLDRDFSVFGEIESGFDVAANLVESDRMTVVRRIADD